jgi:hypothetical protein
VTLRDVGIPQQANGDPLAFATDVFSAEATSATGAAVTLVTPATLSLIPPATAGQDAQDLIIGDSDPSVPQVVQLHHAHGLADGAGAHQKTLSYPYSSLGSRLWVVRIPRLSSPQPQQAQQAETALLAGQGQIPAELRSSPHADSGHPADVARRADTVSAPAQPVQPSEDTDLEVPWYDQGALPWCTATSLTDLLRYYDMSPAVSESLNASFGATTALANWQVAAESQQSSTKGAGYDELTNIGVQFSQRKWDAALYAWDGDFLFRLVGLPGSPPPSAVGGFSDFSAYVVSVVANQHRPLVLDVDSQWHSVVIVGADQNGLRIHDSSGAVTGAPPAPQIAVPFTWDAFRTLAQGYGPKDGHYTATLWTVDLSGYAVRPENVRRGSVVIVPGDLSFFEGPLDQPSHGQASLTWEGTPPHTHGYYFRDQVTGVGADSDLGVAALRTRPLYYQFRVANVTNVPLTFTAVAEVYAAAPGSAHIAQQQTVTVQPYSLSGYLSGTLNHPASGDSAVFDVELLGPDSVREMQDAKLIRYSLKDAPVPSVQITAPANGTHVDAGDAVAFSATSSDPATLFALPESSLVWTANGARIGTGSNVVHSFASTGQYTITLTGTTADGRRASASITLYVDAKPATITPYVKITSPANGAQIQIGYAGPYASVTLTGAGSAGMQFSWSDAIQGNLGSGPSLTVNLNAAPTACHTFHTITLKGVDTSGHSAQAGITVDILNVPHCVG